MALTKETVIDMIEITENGSVQVRRADYILEDGVRIAGPNYKRKAYAPGTDIAHEDARVRAVSDVIWTPEVIDAHRERQSTRR